MECACEQLKSVLADKRRDFYEDMYDDRRYWGNDDYWNDDDDDDVSGEFDHNPWL